MYNIAITTNIKEGENIWLNGIAQNVINFYYILKNSSKNYNLIILDTSEKYNLEYNLDNINIDRIENVVDGLDLLFILGSQIKDEHYNLLKNKGSKIVYYSCGSNYMLDMQEVLFKDKNSDKKIYKHTPDEIWSIPQNYEPNKYYFETLHRRECKIIPFVWSSTFIDYILNTHDIRGYYEPTNEPKRISSFDPNIDIVKYSLYNIMIVEQAYREKPELIKHLYVTNSLSIKDSPLFIDIMNHMDIVKKGIATFESRFRTPYFLDKYTDIVIAHQMHNPLNYAYLDALYLKYPLIHNASLMKDGGYYYDGFNVKKGKEQLLFALTEHDKNLDEYEYKSQKVLNRYLPTNEKSIKIYDKLIKDLMKKL